MRWRGLLKFRILSRVSEMRAWLRSGEKANWPPFRISGSFTDFWKEEANTMSRSLKVDWLRILVREGYLLHEFGVEFGYG